MRNRFKVLAPAAALVAVLGTHNALAGTIASWTFESDAIATNNTPAADSGSGAASSIGMNLYPTPNVGVNQDDVVLGKTSDSGTNSVADTTNTWRVRGQAGSNGAANGWSDAAPIGTQGAIFAAATPAGISAVNISFDWYNTTQGEANLQLEYTTNGTSYTNIPIALSGSDSGLVAKTNSSSANTVLGAYVSDNLAVNGSPAGQDWFTALTATITDPLAINDPNFAIEMVNASTGADCVSAAGTALNNSSGNWRFDNVSIAGTPEPGSLAILGLAGAGLLGRRRRANA